MRVLLVMLIAALALPPSALACIPAPGWPHEAVLDVPAAAAEMTRAAHYVDVARIVGTEPSSAAYANIEAREIAGAKTATDRQQIRRRYALEREDFPDPGLRATFQVVERIKGDSSATFSLAGARPPLPLAESPDQHDWTGAALQLTNWLIFEELANLELNDCKLPLVVHKGMTFLVFRDEAGKLLKEPVPMEFYGRRSTTNGPAYVPVVTGQEPWLLTVRAAAAAEAKRSEANAQRRRAIALIAAAAMAIAFIVWLAGRLARKRQV